MVDKKAHLVKVLNEWDRGIMFIDGFIKFLERKCPEWYDDYDGETVGMYDAFEAGWLERDRKT